MADDRRRPHRGRATDRARRSRTFWLPFVLLVLALALLVLGLFPDRAQALYLTAVGPGLYMGAIGPFATVFWKRLQTA